TTQGVNGKMPVQTALKTLLQNTGLTYQVIGDTTITVKPLQIGAAVERSAPGQQMTLARHTDAADASARATVTESARDKRENAMRSDSGGEEGAKDSTQEIVVNATGTRIRGAQSTSPVLTITQQEMRLGGHNNLG